MAIRKLVRPVAGTHSHRTEGTALRAGQVIQEECKATRCVRREGKVNVKGPRANRVDDRFQSTRFLYCFGPSGRLEHQRDLMSGSCRSPKGHAEDNGSWALDDSLAFSHSSLFLSCLDPPRWVVLVKAHGTLNVEAFHPFMRPLKVDGSERQLRRARGLRDLRRG